LNIAETQITDGRHTARHASVRLIFRWAERGLAVVGLCCIVYHWCFELTVMTSDSMSPTLRGTSYENGDRILVEKVTGWFRSPRRWEVYFLYDAEGTPVAKRIVGLPGEAVSLKENRISINGREIQRPRELQALNYFPFGSLAGGREATCGKGYFVFGDDSQDSYDSRYLGPVDPRQLRGRVWCIVWPPSRTGWIH
jgi:signal peptidase I